MDSITSRDYTLVQGFTVVIAAGFVLINMVVDIHVRLPRSADSLQLSRKAQRLHCMAEIQRTGKHCPTSRAITVPPTCGWKRCGICGHSPIRCCWARSAVIGALIFIAVFAPVFATHDPIKTMIGVPGETGRLAQQAALHSDPGLRRTAAYPRLGLECARPVQPRDLWDADIACRSASSRSVCQSFVGTALGISSGLYVGGHG